MPHGVRVSEGVLLQVQLPELIAVTFAQYLNASADCGSVCTDYWYNRQQHHTAAAQSLATLPDSVNSSDKATHYAVSLSHISTTQLSTPRCDSGGYCVRVLEAVHANARAINS
jgi:hypothetical protein